MMDSRSFDRWVLVSPVWASHPSKFSLSFLLVVGSRLRFLGHPVLTAGMKSFYSLVTAGTTSHPLHGMIDSHFLDLSLHCEYAYIKKNFGGNYQ